MKHHDPLCPIYRANLRRSDCTVCAGLDAARADERQRIAAAIEAVHVIFPDSDQALMRDKCARIARNGGGDE